jgi:hypothetical protein
VSTRREGLPSSSSYTVGGGATVPAGGLREGDGGS